MHLGRARLGRAAQLPGSAEEEDIAVGVADLEAAQAVVGVLKGRTEGYAVIGKLDGEGVGIFYINECVQPQMGMAR